MFYVCCKKGDKLGVMDSKDNVLEFHSNSDIKKYREMGIVIMNMKHMNEIVHYVWHFVMNSREFRGSEFDSVINFMEGKGKNQFGGSRRDYAESLKSNYLTMKEYGFDVLPSNMFSDKSDLLVSGLLDLYGSRDKTVIKAFADKWKLDFEVLNYWYGI